MKRIIIATTLALSVITAEEIVLTFGDNMKHQDEKTIKGCKQQNPLKDGNQTKQSPCK